MSFAPSACYPPIRTLPLLSLPCQPPLFLSQRQHCPCVPSQWSGTECRFPHFPLHEGGRPWESNMTSWNLKVVMAVGTDPPPHPFSVFTSCSVHLHPTHWWSQQGADQVRPVLEIHLKKQLPPVWAQQGLEPCLTVFHTQWLDHLQPSQIPLGLLELGVHSQCEGSALSESTC